jgi:hypothetical protein
LSAWANDYQKEQPKLSSARRPYLDGHFNYRWCEARRALLQALPGKEVQVDHQKQQPTGEALLVKGGLTWMATSIAVDVKRVSRHFLVKRWKTTVRMGSGIKTGVAVNFMMPMKPSSVSWAMKREATRRLWMWGYMRPPLS